ncbi:fumarate hydratase [Verminephrobacter eiseniae]|uniref:Fumarate hydratase class I n=1 Tax=Verminephrobacter eiseniae (strain EF01-2) TaxID=391735 RepID=A1WMT7_VEREI|nr:fumarate hydratase [Verminephrobacter eiseniae]KAB7571622.1 fumarate hydratase [Verminephrobacter sp. Larva24]ABM58944.1 fumarase [Verminephrobacter eiseniae EF01-2]MCW5231116.1 fumarate hydratase [Verminephrobacter eiseniae]MCW5259780.1 fumarate hydratase [Verminephrobacter eiseniae]MCW5284504.1 fumarate hydratase [Verminephrobacter eiseniae]
MTTICQEDLIESIAGALQYISYYHPGDYIAHLARAYEREQSPAAKDAMAQILTNSKMSAIGQRPICQDTGIVNVFLKVGMDVRWQGFSGGLDAAIDEGVRRGYNHPGNSLRASVVADPQFERKNTRDNTPAVVLTEIVPGNTVDIIVAAKGGGSENKSSMYMLNPSDSVVDWVLKTVPAMGAGWCPPGMLGIGIGGTAEKAVLMAKQSLMEHLDMHELQAKAASGARLDKIEELRLELFAKVNALGIGAQGLGGLSTVLDVKIRMYPTHAASKPIAMIPNCAATRHAHLVLDGSGPAYLTPPSLDLWPDMDWAPDYQHSRRVFLDQLTRQEVARWKPGDRLLLNGKMLTGRDAAHQRIQNLLANGEKLPVDFNNRVIYYVGPVDPIEGEAVGPAGPTTATRMDKFTDMMLARTGLIAMIGKAERGPVAIGAIKKHQSAYLMAVGGAAYLVSKAIKSAKVVGFADLGMEAIYEFDVVDMPVTVAVDSGGSSVHITGPAEWQKRIATGEFKGIGVTAS